MSQAVMESEVGESTTASQPPSIGGIVRRKTLLLTGGGVALALLLFFGVRYLVWSAHHEETDDAYLAGHLHPISARVTDTVQQVLIDDNQHVAEGQTLIILDPNDYKVRLDQAKAALDAAGRQSDTAEAAIRSTSQSATAQTTQAVGTIGEAKASIQASKAAVTAAEAGVPRAQAQLQEANATLQREDTDLHRYEDLYTKEQVSKQTVDHQRASYQVAVAGQTAAQEQVRQAQAQLVAAQQGVVRTEALLTNSQGGLQSAQATGLETRVREGQFATAQAAVAQATAALEDAKLQLSYTTIKAPVSGRIGRKSVEAGQRVQIGQPLMAIVEDQLWVVANFKETQLEKMRTGQRVEVQIDTFSKHKFYGHVDSLAPGSGNEFALLPPDNATGNFTKIVQRIPVKIVLDQDSVRGYENLLSPGMSSVVTVTTK
ncbi:HlyD family secretion protein [Tunturiibacter gelidoferens]|uniref:Membrane fusion protein (Multidrug efflux system) n=1 Tax=Tunturiibacter gelidiferens TaxID=3069689 RepID=A0A9X0QAR6_9BACT|nr:HlyD family secretion protein [Edaphobacter lichenicola]MBB5326853.1 membrane fusion protein (multidrug efflux system) [Edaphobacter lichenicola]